MKMQSHDLIKETHCRKMKKCQFALKQNRSMNILTIWQKTSPYEDRKVAEELDKNSAGLPWCQSEKFEQIQGRVLVTGLLWLFIPSVLGHCLCFALNLIVAPCMIACNTFGRRLKS